MKYSRINSTKKAERIPHWKSTRHRCKKLTQINGKTFCVHRPEDLKLWKDPYCPKQSTDSMQSLSKKKSQ